MGALGKYLRTIAGGRYAFWCPGCDEAHHLCVHGDDKARWDFNGNADAPTFRPSVLVTSGHFVSFHKPGDPCWCTYNAENPDDPATFRCYRCHSFVTDGKIQFLDDCTHALAGQTVPLPEWPAPPGPD